MLPTATNIHPHVNRQYKSIEDSPPHPLPDKWQMTLIGFGQSLSTCKVERPRSSPKRSSFFRCNSGALSFCGWPTENRPYWEGVAVEAGWVWKWEQWAGAAAWLVRRLERIMTSSFVKRKQQSCFNHISPIVEGKSSFWKKIWLSVRTWWVVQRRVNTGTPA